MATAASRASRTAVLVVAHERPICKQTLMMQIPREMMRWQDRDSVTSRDESFFPIRRTSTPRRCGACRCSRRFLGDPHRLIELHASGDVTMVDTHQPSAPARHQRIRRSSSKAANHRHSAASSALAFSRARATVMLDPRSSIRCFCIVWPAMSQAGLFVPAPRHLGRKGHRLRPRHAVCQQCRLECLSVNSERATIPYFGSRARDAERTAHNAPCVRHQNVRCRPSNVRNMPRLHIDAPR